MKLKLIALLTPAIIFAQEKSAFEIYGDIFQGLIPLYALGLTLIKKDKEGSVMFAKSYAYTMGTTYAIKYTVNAKRPNGGRQSFPSGHTSSAFAGAWFLQARYGWKQGLPALILAGLVGWSRVYAKAHWDIDVYGSILLSMGITFSITKPYRVSVQSREGTTFLVLEKSW